MLCGCRYSSESDEETVAKVMNELCWLLPVVVADFVVMLIAFMRHVRLVPLGWRQKTLF